MTAVALIDRAIRAGAEIRLVDGQPAIRGTRPLPPGLLQELRNGREAIRAHLAALVAPEGFLRAPDGTLWRLRCRCGMHPHRGHKAKPADPGGPK